MQRVLTSEQMRWCDEITINKYGVPGLLLMENAGRSVVEVIKKKFSNLEQKKVLIVCGKGNNGGDGFVVARLISNYVNRVTVILTSSGAELKGDAKTNFEILKNYAKKSKGRICIKKYSKKLLKSLSGFDLIVDAIFGTGFGGEVKSPFTNIIEWINTQEVPVISIDIPSGVNGTTGECRKVAVHANITVTFGYLKTGLLCNAGRIYSGELHIGDIGIPKSVQANENLKNFLIEKEDVKLILPKRSIFSHKYSVGKVFVLAGSKGLTGAAAMSCNSALRIGAGAVILGTPETVYPILAKKLTEVMVYPLPATDEGTLSVKALENIHDKLEWADVVIVGPGLSQNSETQQLIIKIIMEYKGKILVDADGLNAIAMYGIEKLKSLKSEIILTPHVGEFSRLTKIDSREIERNRITIAKEIAKKIQATVVLKGVPSVTTSADGSVFINSTGNPGMATAGAGDVLSGIIAGLWAQGMKGVDSAWAGVYIHGLSGDISAKKIGEKSMTANDLIEFLPEAIRKIEVE